MIVESNVQEQDFLKIFNAQERLLEEIKEIIKKDTKLEIEWNDVTNNN